MDKRNRVCLNRASRRRTWIAACALWAICLASAQRASAGPVTIDDFGEPDPRAFFVIGSGTNTSEEMSQTTSGAIGGQRDMLVSVVGKAQQDSLVGVVGFDSDYSLDALQVGTAGLSPTVATLQYSGINLMNTPTKLVNNHNLGGGLGVDLTGGGTNNQFVLQFMGVDAQPTSGLDLAITITSPGGKSSTVTAIVPNTPATFNFFVPFANLVGNATPADVTSIVAVFNGARLTPNVDYAVRFFGTVPEPSGAALMTTALAMLALGRAALRRRKRPSG